jgi:hypothetical protein
MADMTKILEIRNAVDKLCFKFIEILEKDTTDGQITLLALLKCTTPFLEQSIVYTEKVLNDKEYTKEEEIELGWKQLIRLRCLKLAFDKFFENMVI